MDVKNECPIKISNEKIKNNSKTKKEYEQLKAHALQFFAAATSSTNKPKKSPKKKITSEVISKAKSENVKGKDQIKAEEAKAKFATPVKKSSKNEKEKNHPRLYSDQNEWKRYSENSKKKLSWKTSEVVYRKKEYSSPNPSDDQEIPSPLFCYAPLYLQQKRDEFLDKLNLEIEAMVKRTSSYNKSMKAISEIVRQKIETIVLQTFPRNSSI